jgi:transposase
MKKRRPYPTDASDEQWYFAAPYLTLMNQDASQRRYELREMFNASRWIVRASAPWHLLPNDFPPRQPLAVHVTPPNEQDRAQVEELARHVQQATGQTVRIAFADQGYTGEEPAAARDEGFELQVVRLPEAKKALYCCHVVGWWSAASAGSTASADWPVTTSNCLKP